MAGEFSGGLTLSGIFLGVAICVATHGVLYATGAEQWLATTFGGEAVAHAHG